MFHPLGYIVDTKKSQHNRDVASGGAGGQCPPDFRFCPPIYFLPPHGIFWVVVFGRKKTSKFVISARKSIRISAKTFFTLKFVISARKSLRISAKTFFFFGDHLIFTETSPQSNSGLMIKLCPPDFNFAPPISRSWRRPCSTTCRFLVLL